MICAVWAGDARQGCQVKVVVLFYADYLTCQVSGFQNESSKSYQKDRLYA